MHKPPDFLNYVGENNYVISARFNYKLYFYRLGGLCVHALACACVLISWPCTFLVGCLNFLRQGLLYVALVVLATL